MKINSYILNTLYIKDAIICPSLYQRSYQDHIKNSAHVCKLLILNKDLSRCNEWLDKLDFSKNTNEAAKIRFYRSLIPDEVLPANDLINIIENNKLSVFISVSPYQIANTKTQLGNVCKMLKTSFPVKIEMSQNGLIKDPQLKFLNFPESQQKLNVPVEIILAISVSAATRVMKAPR